MNILGHLTAINDNLPGALRRIATCILADPTAAAAATISELADLSHTSPATVNRFCRRLGLVGYADLRLAIATDNGRAEQASWQQTLGSDVEPSDSLDRIATVLSGGDIRAIERTVERLDMDVVEAVVTALANAQRIHLFGVAGSYFPANELRQRLSTIGAQAWSWSDVHDGLTSASGLGRGDVLVAFSHSGRTAETLQVLITAADAGAETVAVTNSMTSPLAVAADHCLVTEVNEGSIFRSRALAARHSQQFVIDLLFVAVANRNFDRSHAAAEKAARATKSRLVDHDGRLPRPASHPR